MKINADFNKRTLVHSTDMPWIPSPIAGVDRRPLDRIGDEVARATSIVRYAPGSKFSPHVHTGGEEFIVIDGVFQDEHGDFPVGSYLRNPPESSHTPGSDEGCIIFVKLWQFQMNDRTHIRLRTDHMQAIPHRELPGISVIPLYKDAYEEVSIQQFDANASLTLAVPAGAEVLILEGQLTEHNDILKKGSWLRIPTGVELQATAGSNGARIWIKTGHLDQVNKQINNVESIG